MKAWEIGRSDGSQIIYSLIRHFKDFGFYSELNGRHRGIDSIVGRVERK